MALTLVITGASGFLGQALREVAAMACPKATVIPVSSPRDGGIDLAQSGASERLAGTVNLSDPYDTVLIHAAAVVAWDSSEGFLANAAMAVNVATWARSAKIGFCVLVSGVNVYAPRPLAEANTPCEPRTMYGLGKWAAEQVWRVMLPTARTAIVRLAGLWGWQRRPTLFWNRLLLAATRDCLAVERPIVHRSQSCRNYISAHEASECLVQVGTRHLAGLFLGAGRDRVATGSFVKAVQGLSGSRLAVDWQDDGGVDECLYRPSPELLPWLNPFPETLSNLWANQPNWVLQRS